MTPALSVRPQARLLTHARPLARPRFGQQDFSQLDRDLKISDSPQFRLKIRQEIQLVKTCVQDQLDQGKKGFVVLDVDETALDNRPFYRDPQRIYYRKPGGESWWERWDRWVAQASAPANAEVKALVDWLEQKKVPYAFVTGRIHKQHKPTQDNLRQAGYLGKHCVGLTCKPDTWWIGTTQSNKKIIRDNLEKKLGLPVMASVGDMAPDMTGDPQKDFLLSTSFFYPPKPTS